MERPLIAIPPVLWNFREAIAAMVEPCVGLSPAGADDRADAPRRSRLLGAPVLSRPSDWPHGRNGVPMSFLAQADLEGVSGRGALAFFVDLDALASPAGASDAGASRVVWAPDPGAPVVAPPRGAPVLGGGAVRLASSRAFSLPSEVDARYRLGDLDEQAFRAYEDLRGEMGPASLHRLLGHADWIDGDPSPPGWRLLWQIDGERPISQALGEDVRFFVLVAEDDLADGRLDRTRTVVQSY